jgi:hypothetical protein
MTATKPIATSCRPPFETCCGAAIDAIT